MSLQVVVEDGSGVSGANSYCSLEAASAYLATRLGARWEQAGDVDRIRALLGATELLDQLTWRGAPVLDREAPRWPRAGIVGRDGRALPASAIPECLVRATAALADRMLDPQRRPETFDDPPVSVSGGRGSRSYASTRRPSPIPPSIIAMVDHLILRGVSRLESAA